MSETEIFAESGSPQRSDASALDGSQPLVLTASAGLLAVALVARSALEQFPATPVRTHRKAIDVDGFVVDIVVVGSGRRADVSSESDGHVSAGGMRPTADGGASIGSASRYREVSGYLVGSAAFKAVGMGDPHPAGSIPVHLR